MWRTSGVILTSLADGRLGKDKSRTDPWRTTGSPTPTMVLDVSTSWTFTPEWSSKVFNQRFAGIRTSLRGTDQWYRSSTGSSKDPGQGWVWSWLWWWSWRRPGSSRARFSSAGTAGWSRSPVRTPRPSSGLHTRVHWPAPEHCDWCSSSVLWTPAEPGGQGAELPSAGSSPDVKAGCSRSGCGFPGFWICFLSLNPYSLRDFRNVNL